MLHGDAVSRIISDEASEAIPKATHESQEKVISKRLGNVQSNHSYITGSDIKNSI